MLWRDILQKTFCDLCTFRYKWRLVVKWDPTKKSVMPSNPVLFYFPVFLSSPPYLCWSSAFSFSRGSVWAADSPAPASFSFRFYIIQTKAFKNHYYYYYNASNTSLHRSRDPSGPHFYTSRKTLASTRLHSKQEKKRSPVNWAVKPAHLDGTVLFLHLSTCLC